MCENDPFLTTQQIYGVEKNQKKTHEMLQTIFKW